MSEQVRSMQGPEYKFYEVNQQYLPVVSEVLLQASGVKLTYLVHRSYLTTHTLPLYVHVFK